MIIFRLIFTTILLFSLTTNVYAALGKAAVYKVTMKKVALCTGKGSGTTCLGKVIIGTGDKEVDIASVNAGAVAGAASGASGCSCCCCCLCCCCC